MADRPLLGSDIFADPPSPPNQRARANINESYDSILETIAAIETTMNQFHAQMRAMLDDARKAVEERQRLVIRGDIREANYQLTIISIDGIFSWRWYTDGSSGRLPQGDQIRFGIGGFFGPVPVLQKMIKATNFQKNICSISLIALPDLKSFSATLAFRLPRKFWTCSFACLYLYV